MNEKVQAKLQLLPDLPGCYLMKDKKGNILYIGKAKVLKNRVRSYFSGSHNTKTERLIREIDDFETIVTESDIEALLLEINLIKKNTPKYNILLKDDKTYPFIKLTKEKYPRLLITRKVLKDAADYFGPYPDVGAANETKRLLDKLFPLRKCKTLPQKTCLYYHMEQCLAPCVLKVDETIYQEMRTQIRQFLNGGYEGIQKDLKEKMMLASEELAFEKAAEFRNQFQAIERLMTQQKMTMTDFANRDVFGYAVDKGWLCVQVFFVRMGKVIERDVSIFPFFNSEEEDFLTFIGQFYQENEHIKPKEILVPSQTDIASVEAVTEVKTLAPRIGQKKKLVDLAMKNARVCLAEKFALIEKNEERTVGAIDKLADALQIPTPTVIEAFDNSNISGTSPVSAMVVFVDGKPSKKHYRKFKIRTVTTPDDYETMREVIYRRYSRLAREEKAFPDLILIDGGRGQVEAAKDVLKNQLGLEIAVAGLVKDEKHKTSELLFGDPLQQIPLKRNSEEFFLLHRIQDEVHRFAITFHRNVRSKNSFSSKLDGIEGLGAARKKQLMTKFKSLKNIQNATIEELRESGIPQKVCENIKKAFL